MRHQSINQLLILLSILFLNTCFVFGQSTDTTLMVEIYEKGKSYSLPTACQYSGKVLVKKRGATFNKIWITGLDEDNKHISELTKSDYQGEYKVKLIPGKYQFQVYGRSGEVAKVQFEVDCEKVILPDIVYQ